MLRSFHKSKKTIKFLEIEARADPEVAVGMAAVADRFFSAQGPCVVHADEPVLVALPDEADADALEVAVVLGTGVDAAVLIDPDAAMFEVGGQLELLVMLLQGQEPAQFGPGQVARVTGNFAGRVGFDAIRAAQGEVFRRIEVGEGILPLCRQQ